MASCHSDDLLKEVFMHTVCRLKFQPVTAEDIAVIAPYFEGKRAGICDMSALYLHMCGDALGMEYAVHDDVLFLRRNNKYGISYYPPLLRGECALAKGLPYLSVLEEERVRLCSIPAHETEAFERACRVLKKGTSRRWADYIYRAVDLATLQGHRYNKKRNLVHQFERLYPVHTYEEISPENIGDVVDFMHRFMAEGEMSEDKQYENRRVLGVLADYDRLPVVGGIVRVEGQLAAFTVAEEIDDMLVVHVEKADRSFKGAYQYINYRFVRECMQKRELHLVNREDDAGDEGLRQAKLSYCPVDILHKYHMVIDNK